MDTQKVISTLEDVLRYLERNRKCSCTLSSKDKSGICQHCIVGDKVENLRSELKGNPRMTTEELAKEASFWLTKPPIPDHYVDAPEAIPPSGIKKLEEL